MSSEPNDTSSTEEADALNFILRLFVAGASPASVRAIKNIKAVLDEHLPGRYDLEIIDIHQQPTLAEKENIAAIPVLVKSVPEPKRFLIGDMSDKNKVLRGLGLDPERP